MVHYDEFMNVNSFFLASYTGKDNLGQKSSEWIFKREQLISAYYHLKILKRICGELVSSSYQP